MGGTHGSDIVSKTSDMLEINIIHGMRGVVKMCEMYICLTSDNMKKKNLNGWEDWVGLHQ